MRVAVDARTWQGRPLGAIGRQLAHLLPRAASHVEIHLLTDARLPPVPSRLAQHALRAPSGRGVAWLQLAAPRWLRNFDGVFHCPFYGLPFRLGVPGVASIYDLTFERYPEWFPFAQRNVFRIQARHAARVARVVISPCQHERAELMQTYGVDPPRTAVVLSGIDPQFSPDRADPDLARRFGLADRYIVTLAGAPRRNAGAAVEAWRELRRRGIAVDLAIVGGNPVAPEPGLVATGRLDDETWATLLAGAQAFCYPTLYEGYGFPALEACASGTPVVAGRVGALPEVLGDAARWAVTLEVADLADALEAVLGNEADTWRRAVLARAASAPSWDACAQALLGAYQVAAGG